MCKIMRLQYIVLAGVLLPLILIGSFGYLIPGFVYCKDYQSEPTFLGYDAKVQRISVKEGITTTINSGSMTTLDQFKVDFSLSDGSLTLFPSSRAYPCSNAVLNVSLESGQSLEVTSDNTSPLRLALANQTLDQLTYGVSHFSGQLTVNDSNLTGAAITTPSGVYFQNSVVSGALLVSGSENISLVNSTAPQQNIVAGGDYRYVQLDDESIRSIAVDSNAQNTKHRPQKICVPASAFRGCAALQNKYWLGNVGVRLYGENGSVVEEVSKELRAPGQALKVFECTSEMVKVCYQTEDEEFRAILTMQNRGETVLVLYQGAAPPSECYK